MVLVSSAGVVRTAITDTSGRVQIDGIVPGENLSSPEQAEIHSRMRIS